MKSRSLLPHDSHPSCLSNHHERAEIRTPKQIRLLSLIPIYLALLTVFLVTSCASSSTKPRGEGIGFRLGDGTNSTFLATKGDLSGATYAEDDPNVQDSTYPRFPVFYQFDETLLGNWVGGTTILDLGQETKENIPPSLNKIDTYDNIIAGKAKVSGFDLDSSLTNIILFRANHPTYATKIDAASNPSISASYDFTSITLGYNVYIFYPSSPNHRWLITGLGLGAIYTNGSFSVLLCDPYHIRLTTEKFGGFLSTPTYPGECRKKQELTTVNINEQQLSLSSLASAYQYVGDEWEISVVNILSPGRKDLGEGSFNLVQKVEYLDIISAVRRW